MKLTIVRDDMAVYKDGESFFELDLSAIPDNVHALQFNDVACKGWIEFTRDEFGIKPQNQIIEILPDWAIVSANKWDEAKALFEAQINAAKEEAKKAAAIFSMQQPDGIKYQNPEEL